jgi:fructokinase
VEDRGGIDLITYGEILWDIIDGVPHLGGAPFNLAAHASLCGMKTAVISAVGDDVLGEKALVRAAELAIDTRWIRTDREKPTGTVTVRLKNGIPEYTIHEQVAWDSIVLSDEDIADIAAAKPKFLCFGSLAQRSAQSHNSLMNLLDTLERTRTFFDVNLRQRFWKTEQIEQCLAKTTWLKVNDEEAVLLNRKLFNHDNGVDGFAKNVLALFKVSGVLITCGADGCLVFERGSAPIKSPGVKVDAVDTVGAGDAFSAAFLAALLQGRSAAQAAEIGNHRGALVASQPGAIPVV